MILVAVTMFFWVSVMNKYIKGKAIPLQALRVPGG
jgi:hypothetical protein